VQVIVQVPDSPSVHQERGGVQLTEAAVVLVAIASDFPFQEAVNVWVKEDDFRFVLMVRAVPRVPEAGHDGADFLAIVVSVFVNESFTVPELVLVAYDAETVSFFDPSELCSISSVLL
jgi:hypothetical protein